MTTALLAAQTQALLTHLHRGGAHRMIQNLDHLITTWCKVSESITLPSSPTMANLIFGVHPTTQRGSDPTKPDKRQRSTNATVAAINCLFADFDGKEYTSPTEQEIAPHFARLRADPANAQIGDKALHRQALGAAQEAKYNTDPERYKALALAALRAVPVAASVIVATGGGYHGYWLLHETFHLRTDEDRKLAASIQKRWAFHMGGDRGAGDLARCLRLPGTHNRKARYAPNFPLVEFTRFDLDQTYDLAALAALLPAEETAQPAHRGAQQPTERTGPRAMSANR